MADPYCWPGTTCLRNRLGIRDEEELREAEFRIVSIRDVQAAREPIPGEYNLEHLKDVHRHLFGDNIRTCQVNLQTGGTDELVRVLRPLVSRS